jgi:DNA polymerase elongation subunit (family B)
MFMKRENLADRGVWTAKKRYILNVHNKEGIEYSKPKIKVMGLEMIKSSTPSAVRKKLWESIDILINKTEDEMIEFIESFKKEFKTLPVEDISFPRGVNGLDKYSNADKGIPIHVKGSYLYNNLLKKFDLEKKYQKINQGEKIKYIYLKQPNVYHTKVISFPQSIPSEMKLDGMIDYNTQFQKSFLEPLKAILDCVGWKHERTLTLEAFFS